MSEQTKGAFFRLPADTKDYLSVDDDNKDKNDIGNCFNQSKSLLKTLPGNAIDNHSDKLEAEKVAFADLGSCFLTSDLVFWATFVQFPQISLANAKTQTQ